ncbi:MAG: enoyl-CoA hydratase [Actinomycetia bacterium]|nr:enoyl-CoA hydratase [Actinomycetes bacterium]
MSEPVLVAVDGAVATITLHRPEVRNAINGPLRRGLRKALADLEADSAIAAIVLTGTDPAFSAGLDLKELGSRPADSTDGGGGELSQGSVSPFPARTKPLIGAINGPAITGGFELALNCDFLIASERAVFADTHARVGVMPGWGLSALLADAVGVRRAREISLTGNFVTASEALNWGLVNRVVGHEALLATVQRLATDIANNDQASVARMLATYREQEDVHLADAWRIEGEAANEFRRRVGFDPGEVERRRVGIIERGRSQV